MAIVSVILPTHNRSVLLKTAISSVLSQTYENYEIIVIDDHSTDNTSSVVASFDDPRIRYIQNKGKSGPSVCRNLGILKASGEYVAFLDDDDEWMPSKLEKQIKVLDESSSNVGCIYSKPLLVDKNTGKHLLDDPGVNRLKGNLLSQLIVKSPIHTCTLVIRKKCLDQIGGFDENMRYMEDRDLFIRLAMHWDFEYIDEPLTKAYFHGKNHLSRNLEGQTYGIEILLERYENYIKRDKKNWAKLIVCLGAQYCQLEKMEKGRSVLLKGIIIYPFYKKAFFHFFASFLGAKIYQKIRNVYKETLI